MPTSGRNTEVILRFWSFYSVLCVSVWIAACTGANPASDRAAAQASFQGQQVYQRVCAACHEATDLHLIKDPPRLDGLFKKQTFPSGMPATDNELRNVILHGRGIMPPFEKAVNSDEMDALVQYLHQR